MAKAKGACLGVTLVCGSEGCGVRPVMVYGGGVGVEGLICVCACMFGGGERRGRGVVLFH